MLESLGQIFHSGDVVDELPENSYCKKAINNLSGKQIFAVDVGHVYLVFH